MVAEVLRDTRFPPQCLELELTERIVMRDVDSAVRRMQALRDLGVSIALDDFGTGFSSLSYLPNLPLNVLKIDRSFVAGAADGRTLPIVRAIMSMAEQFGFDVIAEGIETAGHVQAMLDVGCRFGQGYHFARPAPAAELWPAPVPGPRR
jgi:EAL domain-containing protein (putative c-di-GMP-specific phosphodiesterase class I)